MKQWLSLAVAALLLTACGSTNVGDAPGFRNGKATHPLVKLGNPYEVNGTTYYPEYDPEYSEVGMASWYGPGFHGGQTANGERFNTNEMTAAHRTLPLPSIVKVTNLKNDKSVIVRVNDRGPFAHGRILDVSKTAANKLDMIRSGVAKVRVEYMPEASRRYIALLESGRNPSNINVERDVLMADNSFAEASRNYQTASQQKESSWFDRINPISSAHAAEPVARNEVIPVETKTTKELPPLDEELPAKLPPATVTPQPTSGRTPFDLLNQQKKIEAPQKPATPAAIVSGYAVQLGVFGNESNALNLKRKLASVGDASVTPVESNGRMLYRVRMGPYNDEVAAREIRDRVRTLGVTDAKIIQP
jgi:rare lipoprotein A